MMRAAEPSWAPARPSKVNVTMPWGVHPLALRDGIARCSPPGILNADGPVAMGDPPWAHRGKPLDRPNRWLGSTPNRQSRTAEACFHDPRVGHVDPRHGRRLGAERRR